MKNYYCLVAGLPEMSPDDTKPPYSVERFREEFLDELSETDRKLVEIFYLQFDNQNLLRLQKEGENASEWDERGLLSKEDLLEAIKAVRLDNPLPQTVPAYMQTYLQMASDEGEVLSEDVLTSCYYSYATTSRNAFFKRWFTFCLNVNNILIALIGRRFGFAYAPYIIGDNDVAQALRHSLARDFGLSTEVSYFDELVRISETPDVVEKERKLDLLKWNWLEEETFFHYFSVERIFAFLLRLNILERWSKMDKEKGGDIFRKLIKQLKDEVEIPAEYIS